MLELSREDLLVMTEVEAKQVWGGSFADLLGTFGDIFGSTDIGLDPQEILPPQVIIYGDGFNTPNA